VIERASLNPAAEPRSKGRVEHTKGAFGSYGGSYVWLEAIDTADAFIVRARKFPRPGTLIAIPLVFGLIALGVFYMTGVMEQQPVARGRLQAVATGLAVLTGLGVLLIQIGFQSGAHADGPLLRVDKVQGQVELPRYKAIIQRSDILALETLIAVPEGEPIRTGRVSLNHNALALVVGTERGEASWRLALHPGFEGGVRGLASEIAKALDLRVHDGLRNPTARYICWHCGYCLAGLEPEFNEYRCPECGGKTPRA